MMFTPTDARRDTPPGYLTTAETCERLGISRQHLSQSGLDQLMPRYMVGTTLLFDADTVGQMQACLELRRVLIGAGCLPANQALSRENLNWLWDVYDGATDPGCDGWDLYEYHN